jgi:hypothetical protein
MEPFQWTVVTVLGLLVVILWQVSHSVLAICDVLLKISKKVESLEMQDLLVGRLDLLDMRMEEITDILKDWNDKSHGQEGV